MIVLVAFVIFIIILFGSFDDAILLMACIFFLSLRFHREKSVYFILLSISIVVCTMS